MATFGYTCTTTFVEETQDYNCVITFNDETYKLTGSSLVDVSKFATEFYLDVVLPSANTELVCEVD
jgi:hypothetical protein